MPDPTVIPGDMICRGAFTPATFNAPASCIGDNNVNGSNPITSPKLQHRHLGRAGQANGSPAANELRQAHYAYGAGSVLFVKAGVVTAAVGGATVAVDVKANGVSILTSTITIDSTVAPYAAVAGSIATAAYTAGTVFTVQFTTGGSGTLPQGVWAEIGFDEAAS